MKKKYYVLENENKTGPDINKTLPVLGPFSTIQEAKDFILADADDVCSAKDCHCFNKPDEDWGSRYSIVRLEGTYIPVPTVRVSFKLMRAQPNTNQTTEGKKK